MDEPIRISGQLRIGDGTTKFGFYNQAPVLPAVRRDYDKSPAGTDDPLFEIVEESDGRIFVQLPHSCDEWVLAYGTKEETVRMLNSFVGAALVALGKLTTP